MSEKKDLKKELIKSPFNYSLHIVYIDQLRKSGNLNELRSARTNLHKIFPLPPKKWIEWIEDEIKLALHSEEKLKCLDLFNMSLKDYLSEEIWIKFLKYAINIHQDHVINLDKLWGYIVRAIEEVGSFCNQIWTIIYNFIIDHEENISNERIKYVIEKNSLVPLSNLDEFYKLYEHFVKKNKVKKDKSVISNFLNSKSLYLNHISIWEKKIAKLIKNDTQQSPGIPSESLLFTLESYTQMTANNTPMNLNTLFERCITLTFLHPKFWELYLNHIIYKTKSYKLALIIIRRGIRNIPNHSNLWCEYIKLYERLNYSSEKVIEIFNQSKNINFPAINDNIKIYLCFFNYYRHKMTRDNKKEIIKIINERLEEAINFIKERNGENLSGYCELLEYKISLNYQNNLIIQNCHKEIILYFKNRLDSWINFILYEFQLGNHQKCLELFHKWAEHFYSKHDSGALSYIVKRWIQFMNENCSLIDEDKYHSIIKKYENKENYNYKNENRKRKLKPYDSLIRKKVKNYKMENKGIKKDKTENINKGMINNNNVKKLDIIKEKEEIKRKELVKGEGDTIFIVNIDRRVKDKEINELFSHYGKIKELRMPKNDRGIIRGYAYIQYVNKESVNKAIKELNNIKFKSKILSVQRSRDDKNVPNTVYLRMLPRKECDFEIRKIFKECGEITEIRRPIDYKNNSKPKPFCYVTFRNSKSVIEALKLKSIKIFEKEIIIEKCHPIGYSIKKPEKTKYNYKSKFTSFIPMSVIKGRMHRSLGKVDLSKKDQEIEEDKNKESKGLSNDEFRKMFLKK